MPICTNQGQISSGLALIVTARVALKLGCLTTSSPGMGRCTSSLVAPHRSCHGRMNSRYPPAAPPMAANIRAIFLNMKEHLVWLVWTEQLAFPGNGIKDLGAHNIDGGLDRPLCKPPR